LTERDQDNVINGGQGIDTLDISQLIAGHTIDLTRSAGFSASVQTDTISSIEVVQLKQTN